MSVFTKGPWKVEPYGDDWIVRTEDGVDICDVSPLGTEEEYRANADILAAAPELLSALKAAQRFIARVDDLHQTIYVSGLDEECQAAIRKAENPNGY